MQSTMSKKYWTLDLLLLIFLIGVFFAIFLGAHSLLVPDEGRYAEIAREMVVNGDYVTPFLNGIVFLDKPIFFYWLECSAIKLFGLSEWSLRFWPCVIGVWGCLVAYIAGRILFNRRAGIMAACILATFPLYYFMAHYANMDLEVAVFISTALFFFIIGARLEDSVKRSLFLWGAYVFAAFAFLTKGMIGIFFPAMIIGCWIIILNNWRILKRIHLITGLIIFILITVPWFILEQRANHEFFHYFFFIQHITRFLAHNYNNVNPFWFYLPVIVMGVFPWFIFLGQTIWQKIKFMAADRKQCQTELFLLLWSLLVLIFFSIPSSKLIGYILPVFPPIALLIGSYLDSSLSSGRTIGIKIGINVWIIFSLIMAIILFYLPYFHAMQGIRLAELKNYCYLGGAILGCSSLGSLFFSYRQKWVRAISVLILTNALFQINIFAAFPTFGFTSTKPLALKLNSLLQPNDIVVSFYHNYYDLPVYIQRSVFIVEDWTLYNDMNSDDWRSSFLYASKLKGSQKELLISVSQLQKLWHDKKVYIFVQKNNLVWLSNILNVKLIPLDSYQNNLLISN